MIGYVTLGTNDLPRAKAFYDALLAEIGITRLMAFGDRGYAWGAAMDQPMLCIMKPFDGRPATVGNEDRAPSRGLLGAAGVLIEFTTGQGSYSHLRL